MLRFFFQAEDGIRDDLVTGVQTCALPISGTTTGAIIQSLAYSPMAIAFSAPVMAATILRMLLSGSDVGYIVAADVVFLTVMLFRAALLGERNFTTSQNTAFEATALAASLADANQALERLVRM